MADQDRQLERFSMCGKGSADRSLPTIMANCFRVSIGLPRYMTHLAFSKDDVCYRALGELRPRYWDRPEVGS